MSRVRTSAMPSPAEVREQMEQNAKHPSSPDTLPERYAKLQLVLERVLDELDELKEKQDRDDGEKKALRKEIERLQREVKYQGCEPATLTVTIVNADCRNCENKHRCPRFMEYDDSDPDLDDLECVWRPEIKTISVKAYDLVEEYGAMRLKAVLRDYTIYECIPARIEKDGKEIYRSWRYSLLDYVPDEGKGQAS